MRFLRPLRLAVAGLASEKLARSFVESVAGAQPLEFLKLTA